MPRRGVPGILKWPKTGRWPGLARGRKLLPVLILGVIGIESWALPQISILEILEFSRLDLGWGVDSGIFAGYGIWVLGLASKSPHFLKTPPLIRAKIQIPVLILKLTIGHFLILIRDFLGSFSEHCEQKRRFWARIGIRVIYQIHRIWNLVQKFYPISGLAHQNGVICCWIGLFGPHWDWKWRTFGVLASRIWEFLDKRLRFLRPDFAIFRIFSLQIELIVHLAQTREAPGSGELWGSLENLVWIFGVFENFFWNMGARGV